MLTDISSFSSIDEVEFLGLDVRSNDLLPTLPLPALTTTNLTIMDNPVLTSVDLSMLMSVTDNLEISGNPMLPQCEVDALIAQVQAAVGIGGTVTTVNNDKFAACE